MADLLLKYGARVNDKLENGETALLFAAGAFVSGDQAEAVVKALLSAGANPNPTPGPSPLALALVRDHAEAAEALRAYGGQKAASEDLDKLEAQQLLARAVKEEMKPLATTDGITQESFIKGVTKAWDAHETAMSRAGLSVESDERIKFLAIHNSIYQRSLLSEEDSTDE